MATKRQKLFLIFFLSKASLFGLGYSLMFSLSGKDTWISVLFGTFIGTSIVFMISKIMNNKQNIDINRYLEKNYIIKILLIILSCYFILEELTTLTNFMTSFYLLKTPNYVIGVCSIIVTLYIVNKGLNSILRASEIIFYITLFMIISSLLILLTYTKTIHLLPVLTTPPKPLFKSSIIFSLYTTIPLINLLNLENNGKKIILSYILTNITIVIITLAILGIFGSSLTKIIRFPEYIVLKRIKILSFIEKIENILSITYIYDNLFLMIFSAYTVKNIIKNKIVYYMIIISTLLFTIIFINNNYIYALNNYYLTPYIFSIGLIIIIILYIKAQKKKPKLQIQRDT